MKMNYLKYINSIRRSKLVYLLFLIAILPKVIWTTRQSIPETAILNVNLNFLINNLDNLDFFSLNPLKFMSILWIFLIISIFEFIKSKNINYISLARSQFSGGGKYADLVYFVLTQFGTRFTVLRLISTLGLFRLSGDLSNGLHKIFEIIIPSKLFTYDLNLYILFLIGILFTDFALFVGHRIAHDYLWELHEFHHSATEMTILNVSRNSILEEVITGAITAPAFILGVVLINESIEQGQWIVFALWTLFGILGELFGFIGHSSFKFIYPKPLSYILLSPSLHWIHHSNNPKHFNKNFGHVFSIWDRLYGTYLDESHLKDIDSFGVEDSDYIKYNPFYCFYILPIKKIINKIQYDLKTFKT